MANSRPWQHKFLRLDLTEVPDSQTFAHDTGIESTLCLQARLVQEASLGDAASKFAMVEGVTVHYKCARPASGHLQAAIHCFHGFGANTGTWEAVLRKLAHSASALVTAHDMPGFGLTER